MKTLQGTEESSLQFCCVDREIVVLAQRWIPPLQGLIKFFREHGSYTRRLLNVIVRASDLMALRITVY